jgi:hypothetical protein
MADKSRVYSLRRRSLLVKRLTTVDRLVGDLNHKTPWLGGADKSVSRREAGGDLTTLSRPKKHEFGTLS